MRITIPKPAKTSFQPVLRRKCACGGDAGPTGECAECRKKREPLRRHALAQSEPGAVPEIVHDVLQGSGEPLDAESRRYMEPRFNRDFSAVRIHRGPMAAEAAKSVQAAAFTIGRDVVFSDHYYQPQTPLGRYLLAHE